MIQSVRRAGAILRELGSGQPRLGVTELSERLGLAKATVYGLLRSLEADELVERDVETGKYRLGPALLQLGNAFLDGHELRARSLLWADSLAGRTTEAVRVGVPNGTTMLVIAPRLPTRQLGRDPRGRRGDPLACLRAREGARRAPRGRRARRAPGGAADAADRAHDRGRGGDASRARGGAALRRRD